MLFRSITTTQIKGLNETDIGEFSDTQVGALTTAQVVAMSTDQIAAIEFTDPADLDTVRAFALQPLDGFALHRGTWHWGPFPVGDAPVHLWNVQGKRYAEDNRCAELPALLDTTLEITG